jgi:hypothetical protein
MKQITKNKIRLIIWVLTIIGPIITFIAATQIAEPARYYYIADDLGKLHMIGHD